MNTAIDVSWFWDWVPATGRSPEDQTAWTAYVAGLLDAWAGGSVAAAREVWPVDGPVQFPFTVAEMGAGVARDLLQRADALPPECRLIWGAGFLDGDARWLPLLVVAEFRPALPQDPAYLMTVVGAEGFPGDIREPNVDYVSTEHGDGIRVLAMARSDGDGFYARVNAALRLQQPGAPGSTEADVDVDVVLSTRVAGLDQIAVIGLGVEALMTQIAAGFGARSDDGTPVLRFHVRDGRDLS